MLMGYRSTPHPATGYFPYEALMKRNVRTKFDYGSFSISRKYHKMEREITKRHKQYKQKWNNQHRNPKVEKHQFKICDRVLLKKKKQYKWSSACVKELYFIIGIRGSTIEAKRKSGGRTMQRDASKFKLVHEDRSRVWREHLLRSSRPSHIRIPNTADVIPTQAGRNEGENEAMKEGYENEENGNQQHDVEERRQHNRQQEPLRRQQPQRTGRPPYKLKDYVVGFKNRETEL